MGLLSVAYRNLRHAGLDAVREVAWRSYLSVGESTPPDPVLDADWELLVVIDACRADLFRSVVAGEEFDLDPGEVRVSPASSSVEWLEAVFGDAPEDALDGVGYVTGNPYTARHLDGERLAHLDEVWRYAWDDGRGTIPPRPITDRAIAAARDPDLELDRLVVHYMQPHFPSVASDDGERRSAAEWGETPISVWEDLRFGGDVDAAWDEYRANLECVLADVELLLSNVDADPAVVTADHGNAFGERYIYGHPAGVDLPCLREVPWGVQTATDRETHQPETGGHDGATTGDEEAAIDDRLRSLGYRT